MKRVRIRLVNVSKSYYSEAAVTQALRKINLTFSEGEFVAITGESGSGKSTLLNIIGGIDTFDDGEMYIDGQPTLQYDDADWEDYRREKIGYVFQDYSLIGHYSAIDNVVSALLIMDKDLEESRKIAKEYLKQVGLEGFETHRASQLSSGQKQRLSIARALAKDTGIIVADEPTGNLDSETSVQIIQLLKELSKTRLVIMVTHNYDLVEPYATRKVRLHDGELISDVGGVSEGSGEDDENSDGSTLKESDGDSGRGGASGSDSANSDNSASKGSGIKNSNKNTSNSQLGESVSSIPAEDVEETATPASAGNTEETATSASAGNVNNSPSTGSTQQPVSKRALSRKRSKAAARFASLNRRSQIGRSVLFLSFFLIVSVVSFLFIGELYAHADDTLTKLYSQTGFYQVNSKRLVVRHPDGSEITDEDVEVISSIANVTAVDSCDYCNDINYYMVEDTDYEITYSVQREGRETKEVYIYSFLNENHFMRSSDCISEDDLAAGSLPENLTDIVVYSNDESLIGTTVQILFTAANIWGSTNTTYCSYELTIVGILKDYQDQVYFSTEFCQMMGSYVDQGYFRLYTEWDDSKEDYQDKSRYIVVIGDDLEGNQVRLGGAGTSVDEIVEGESETVLFHFEDIDENGDEDGNAIEQNVEKLSELSESSDESMEVSAEFFYTYYTKSSNQASVYITNYAKTDDVMNKLEAMGYQVISTYRVSKTTYSTKLVNNRMMIIGICAFGLLVLAIAQILILRSLMKIRIKDYFVLKFIGMKLGMIKRIGYYEMLAHAIAAVVITVVAMWVMRYMGVDTIVDVMWYVEAPAYLLFVLYNLLLCVLTVAAFNHLLKGRLNS